MAHGARTSAQSQLTEDTGRAIDVSVQAVSTALTTAASARTWTRTSVTWATDDGTGEIELTLATGAYQVMAVGHENAVGAGSATYQIHMSTETGFTPGANRYEFYTSSAAIALPSGEYEAFLTPVPITVTGDKVYIRVIPNAGTTTGALDIYTRPNS